MKRPPPRSPLQQNPQTPAKSHDSKPGSQPERRRRHVMRFDDPATAPVRHHRGDQPETTSERTDRGPVWLESIFRIFLIPCCSGYRWKPVVPGWVSAGHSDRRRSGPAFVEGGPAGSEIGPPSIGGEMWCEGVRHQMINVGGGDLIVVEKTADIQGSDQPILDQIGVGAGTQ